MEAIILKTLGDVNGLDASCFFESTDVENKFMSATRIFVRVQNWIMGAQARHDIVRIEKRDLGSMC